jgi:hypothetical protein
VKRWLISSLTANNREQWQHFPPGVIYEKIFERFQDQSLKKRHELQVEMTNYTMDTPNMTELIEDLTEAFEE